MTFSLGPDDDVHTYQDVWLARHQRYHQQRYNDVLCVLQPFSMKDSIERCQEQWGVTPRPMWATIQWGGRRIETASNIVFSNGLYDPW